MTELKTRKNDASASAFLESITDSQKRRDSQVICRLMQEVTGEEPSMWGSSIVGFGAYHYKYASGKEADWMLVGFSPRKANLTLYIMSGFDEYAKTSGYSPKPLLGQLGKYSTGKSCLYIKQLSDVNMDVLRRLIDESCKHMKVANQSL